MNSKVSMSQFSQQHQEMFNQKVSKIVLHIYLQLLRHFDAVNSYCS